MTEKPGWEKRLTLLAVVLMTALIWGNSLLPRQQSGAVSEDVAELLEPMLQVLHMEPSFWHYFVRKAAHFTEFFLLGSLWILFLRVRHVPFSWFYSLGFSVITAWTDEGLQLLSGRNARIEDVVLDSCGALAGVLFTLLALGLITRICSHISTKRPGSP